MVWICEVECVSLQEKYNTMQKEDFQWFVDNHDELFRKYPDRYLVISNKEVVLTESSLHRALNKALASGMEYGSFIIQLCSEGDSAYTVSYHSREEV